MLCGYLWCMKSTQCSHKGNRNHAILSCQHKNISDFRRKTTNLIKLKFRLFFLDLKCATNLEQVTNCVAEVEKLFLLMQETNEGRFKPMNKGMNNMYAMVAIILEQEGMSNVDEALNSKKLNFCWELFGLSPMINGMAIQDDHIGVMDCTWLGLTPKVVDLKIKSFCNKVYTSLPTRTLQMPYAPVFIIPGRK